MEKEDRSHWFRSRHLENDIVEKWARLTGHNLGRATRAARASRPALRLLVNNPEPLEETEPLKRDFKVIAA